MSLSRSLYELQQIDSEFSKSQKALKELEHQLGESEALLRAKTELASAQKYLAETEAKKREMEWEVEDLEAKIQRLKDKLYGGKIKNPKELLNLEHEVEVLKRQLREKEDKLLDLMVEVESARDRVHLSSQNLEVIHEKWRKEQELLTQERDGVTKKLIELNQKREVLAAQIDLPILQLYEQIKLNKGQAVVKVEQGRCQGCRLTLPVSEWQRVRTGVLVMCSNCGRILYLE